jgi:hypothetical protein
MKKLKENQEMKDNTQRSDPTYKDKRRWKRFEFDSPVLFQLLSLEEEEPKLEENLERPGQILDISLGGVLLTTNKPVIEGNLISLNLNLKGLKKVRGILGKVKRVEESEQGDFLMGVEFCSFQNFSELDRLALTKKNIQSFDAKIKQVIATLILAKEKDKIKV